jgi:hypothetical protein
MTDAESPRTRALGIAFTTYPLHAGTGQDNPVSASPDQSSATTEVYPIRDVVIDGLPDEGPERTGCDAFDRPESASGLSLRPFTLPLPALD